MDAATCRRALDARAAANGPRLGATAHSHMLQNTDRILMPHTDAHWRVPRGFAMRHKSMYEERGKALRNRQNPIGAPEEYGVHAEYQRGRGAQRRQETRRPHIYTDGNRFARTPTDPDTQKRTKT